MAGSIQEKKAVIKEITELGKAKGQLTNKDLSLIHI